jgi:hypothetical protein
MLEYLPEFKTNSLELLSTIKDCLDYLERYKETKDVKILRDIPRCPVSLLEDLYKERGFNVHINVWNELSQHEQCDNHCSNCWAKFLELNIDKTNATNFKKGEM